MGSLEARALPASAAQTATVTSDSSRTPPPALVGAATFARPWMLFVGDRCSCARGRRAARFNREAGGAAPEARRRRPNGDADAAKDLLSSSPVKNVGRLLIVVEPQLANVVLIPAGSGWLAVFMPRPSCFIAVATATLRRRMMVVSTAELVVEDGGGGEESTQTASEVDLLGPGASVIVGKASIARRPVKNRRLLCAGCTARFPPKTEKEVSLLPCPVL